MLVTLLISLLFTGDFQRDTLPSARVSSSWKLPRQAAPGASVFLLQDLESRGLKSPKNLSAEVPNLHIPDYGSAMTSSIYLRGFGSRIDNPVIGLYIDDVPVMDKNAYDFDFLDIRRADLLRGPQGTLYGRNALAGILSLQSLSPADWQGTRIRVEGGSFTTLRASAALYKGSWGAALQYRHSNGYYVNSYDGSSCDGGDDVAFRLRYVRTLPGGTALDNSLSASALNQRGYPYRQWVDGVLQPVAYNDPCGYRRITVTEALKLAWSLPEWDIRSISSLQGLWDGMRMDNDFTTAPIFTLEQRQSQGTLTQEVILRPRRSGVWEPVTGFFGFLRYNRMEAPVTFLSEGIESLILFHANEHLPDYIGKMGFQEDNFVISSNFDLFYGGAALYHESVFHWGGWDLMAGVRLDYEGQRMGYDSRSLVHFYYIPAHPEPYPCETLYRGALPNHCFQVLPKLAVRRNLAAFTLTASAAKGYKAGGFNTQIFSDILQYEMMNRLMELSGIKLENQVSAVAENTTYQPESCWDFEVGGQWASERVNISLTGFYIAGYNQQITVFPPGKTTGRMMRNAGRSFSAGVEAQARYAGPRLELSAAYGFTEARFLQYHDGNADYAGKHIPYCPQQTLSLRASWRQPLGRSALLLGVGLRGTGRIWWNEDNSLSQDPYALLGADITWSHPHWSLFLRGENLTGTRYNTFYFKSMGNAFFQQARPRIMYIGLNIQL